MTGYGGPSGYEFLSRTAGLGTILNSSDIISTFHYVDGMVFANGLGLVINESLQVANLDTPKSRFPFGRLVLVASNTSNLYVYHQINESALAEEEYVTGAGWITRLIPVSTG